MVSVVYVKEIGALQHYQPKVLDETSLEVELSRKETLRFCYGFSSNGYGIDRYSTQRPSFRKLFGSVKYLK